MYVQQLGDSQSAVTLPYVSLKDGALTQWADANQNHRIAPLKPTGLVRVSKSSKLLD